MKTIRLQGLCECAYSNFKIVPEDPDQNSDNVIETLNLRIENLILISFNYLNFISMIFYYFYQYLNVFISLILLTIELRESVELHARNVSSNRVICRKVRGSFV